MSRIKKMLSDRAHRPFPIPTSKWLYYQEWNDALFLHYKVPYTLLKSLLPKNLKIDTFNGEAYISIVPFTMQNIRPRLLPAVGFVSDFHEINVRTYIDMDGRKGVYFLNIEAEKLLSAFFARRLSGLPYEKSHILRQEGYYKSVNKRKGFSLETSFSIGETLTNKTYLDLWLTELLLIPDRERQYLSLRHTSFRMGGKACNPARSRSQL